MNHKQNKITDFDLRLIELFRKSFVPFARLSIFLIFFWFGALKALQLSPASPLAEALTAKTVGIQYFEFLFVGLALLECTIGVLFLIPHAIRLVIPLLLLHMLVVCSPLVLVPEYTWQSFLVPSLEGQYIIKNAVVVAVAIGIAATAKPIKR